MLLLIQMRYSHRRRDNKRICQYDALVLDTLRRFFPTEQLTNDWDAAKYSLPDCPDNGYIGASSIFGGLTVERGKSKNI
jgi:hypothetical protein